MTAISRQNTLFVAEDWIRIYEALENVDFRAYDQETLTQAMLGYLSVNFPEEFNDWIASSEFVMKIEILAWLSQNVSFRHDLNTRENFLATAERRNSLVRLAQNIAYKVNRVRGASGEVKIVKIKTNQSIIDSNDKDLRDRTITWNDPKNEDWFEQFILVANAAFNTRTKFGKPLVKNTTGSVRTEQYIFNSIAPSSGSYPFTTNVNGASLPFNIINAKLDKTTGVISELAPNNRNTFNMFYKVDGKGFGSSQTGFFLQIRQGNLVFQDEVFNVPVVLRRLDLNTENINNDDFFVQEVDDSGAVISDWTKIDTIFGEGVSFNTATNATRKVYELDTLVNDKVRVKFGDGTFGEIPQGKYRFWYRTSNPTPQTVNPNAIQNQNVTIPYIANNQVYYLTLTYSLQTPIINSARSESNFDIRTRANRVYYTQNRMITGRDMNNFFLKDNSIRKVKTVNRTFTGQSRFSKLNDPTGVYQNIKVIGDDGRYYEKDTVGFQFVTADTDLLSNGEIINRVLKPLVLKEDKKILYYNKYPEIFFTETYRWIETSIVAGQSRGNITDNGTPLPVGEGVTTNLKYIKAEAVVRYESVKGPIFTIDRVVDDGTATDGVILRQTVPANTNLISVFPAFRTRFTTDEQRSIENRLEDRLDFGLSWNQANESWDLINVNDVNKTGVFDLTNQGDTSSTGLDASWLILVEFVPGGTEDDQWKVTDRGTGTFFESAREVDFYYAGDERLVDSETGETVRDDVTILASNESRDSLRRKGLAPFVDSKCDRVAYQFFGDGVTTVFKTQETPLVPENTVVSIDGGLQILGVDYFITNLLSGDTVTFNTAPADGTEIVISISALELKNVVIGTKVLVGDGSTVEIDTGQETVVTDNVIAFIDGILQDPSSDYGTGRIGNNASIIYTSPIATGLNAISYIYGEVNNNIFTRLKYTGDGITKTFALGANNQSKDTVLAVVDGVIQATDTYTVDFSDITFNNPPGAGTQVRFIAVSVIDYTKTRAYTYVGNGTTTTFEMTGLSNIVAENVIVALDGVLQEGPFTGITSPQWSIVGTNNVLFNTAPANNLKVSIFVVQASVGTLTDLSATNVLGSVPSDGVEDNLGATEVSSCLVNYLGEDIPLNVVEEIRHDDGYVNVNGLFVEPVDNNNSGFFDNPFVFRDLVVQNGVTDLVLWRKIVELGVTVLDPISPLTKPKGTYGLSTKGEPKAGDAIDTSTTEEGDIHYDSFTDKWLVANGTTDVWDEAADQTQYEKRIGRDNLRFLWRHYSPDANRIDPSQTNAMDVYLLTSTYDDTYRTWLINNGLPEDEPVAPTSEELRVQFSDFENFKALSDALIYHTSRYKLLFGVEAIDELQATFKVIQTSGSRLSENDLKLRVLNSINEYFDVRRWDFGEIFYFTELAAFIHTNLAPEVQSIVIVPKDTTQAFGRLFQVRSEPDELFISSANAEDIEVVSSFTDEELRIGSLVV